MRGEMRLHLLEELALFFADVIVQELAQPQQVRRGELVLLRAVEDLAQLDVFDKQSADQWPQLGDVLGGGEDDLFFRLEVPADLRLPRSRDFAVPMLEVEVAGLRGALDIDAERERVVVLLRERDEGRVALHASSILRGSQRSCTA